MEDALQIDAETFQSAIQLNMSNDELVNLVKNTLQSTSITSTSVLASLGYVDYSTPGSIWIYPKSFESKNQIVDELNAYNDAMRAQGEDDKVIVFSPFYENYGADTILSGAEPIYVPLHPPEFSFDPNELEDAFRQHPKALILCNPSNPCGKVFTRQELETIAQLAVKYDTYVITDEVYEHIVYAPNVHTYFATLPGMWERTISCSSLSKTYSITGWRLGYIIAPPEIIDVAKKVHDFLTVGAAAPLQEAAVTGLRFGPEYYKWLQDKYTGKRDLFLQGLRDLKIPHTEPQGAYYVMLDISEFGFDSDLEFCEVLARDVGVGAVPGSSFFREPVNHLIRFHFAKKDETLTEALNRLADLRKKITARK